ncbi:hypothetical protein Tco_0913472, partial [Tanacetum coccineum]
VSCVTGSTTDRDPISKKRKTRDGNIMHSALLLSNFCIASDDSKEYDEPISKKRKTVDHNVINNKQIKDTYHEDLIKRSFRECLGDICCYGTVKHNDLGSEMGAEKRDERKMFGC